jgi:hypothetical protein
MRTLNLISIALNAIWAGIGMKNKMRVCLSLLLLGFALTATQTAQAQITVNGNPSDWPGVFTDASITFKTFVTDPYNSSADDQYTVGSSDEDAISGWGWNNSLVNDKTDLNHAAMALIGHKLYFMGDRYANNGDASIGIWVLKNKVNMLPGGTFSGTHADGDILITAAFTGGGGTPEKHIYKMLGGVLTEVMLSTAAANIAVNTGNIAAPVAWGYVPKFGTAGTYPENAFFEGFVDIDSLGFGVDICFTEFFMSTRNSQSTSASLQDLVRGLFATRPIVTVADDTVCAGQAAIFTAMVTGGLAPYTYAWNGGSYAAANTYTINPATVNTVVTVLAKGDNGCISEPDTANLVVKPAPTVNTIGNRAHCNGDAATGITFSSTPPGATFAWMSSSNVGFGTAGTGSIGSYTAVNTGTAPVVATVSVTPTADGCPGNTTTFMVTVNPTPTANAVDSRVHCNGDAAGSIAFSGPVAGTTFSWMSSANVGFGTGATNVTSIGAYTATNTGTTPVVATVTVIPTANSCEGPAITFNVTVNPTPNVNAHDDAQYCPNTLADAINFSGGVSGATYNWTSTADVGFGTGGSGNIDAYLTIGTFIPVTATVVVTPVKAGCTGATDTFVITVNPTPGPNAPLGNDSLCNGAMGSPIDLTGLDTTVTTHWTSSVDVGFGLSGDGDIPSYIGTNGTAAPLVTTVTVTSISDAGCAGNDTTGFLVTVYPDPNANAPVDNIFLCSGASADSINLKGLDNVTTFSWTSTSDVGFGTAGTGNIPPYTAATNPGPGAMTATVTVTGMSPNGCPGDTTGFIVTIYPNPTTVARDTAICLGISIDLASLGIPPGGIWAGEGLTGSVFNMGGGLPADVYGVLYTYTDINGCNNADSAYITLNALPTVFAGDTAICASVASIDLTSLGVPPGGTWSGEGVTGTTFSTAGLSAGAHGVMYTYAAGTTCVNSDSAYITINPLPNVVARDTAICAGVALNLVPMGTPAGGTWSGTGVSSDMFNDGGALGAGVYTVTYTYTDANTCTSSDDANITINAAPTVVARDTSICASIVLDLNLLSDPDGGTWSGTGASGTTFNGSGLSLGAHGLLYSYTDVNGCSASDSAYITLTSCGNVFGTFTQGFWGSTNGKHCDGAGNKLKAVQIIANALASGQIVVGRPGRSVIIPVGAATIVNAVMPGGKTPNKLKVASDVTISNTAGSTFAINYLTGGKINNVFLSQVIAIKLAVRMNAGIGGFPIEYNPGGASWFQVQNTTSTNCVDFAPIACSADSFSFKYSVTNYLTKGGTQPATLADLINLADDLLGGVLVPSTAVGGYIVPSYADVSGAIDMMNNAFDNWAFFTGAYGTNLNAGCYGGAKAAPGSKTTEDAVTLQSQTHIYPNPTTGSFTIDLPAMGHDANVRIVDLNGRTIMSVVIPANAYRQSVPVELPSGISHGVYLLHLESNGNTFTSRFNVR